MSIYSEEYVCGSNFMTSVNGYWVPWGEMEVCLVPTLQQVLMGIGYPGVT